MIRRPQKPERYDGRQRLFFELGIVLALLVSLPLLLMSLVTPGFLGDSPNSQKGRQQGGLRARVIPDSESPPPKTAQREQEEILRRDDFLTQFHAEDVSEPPLDSDTTMVLRADFENGQLFNRGGLNVLVLEGTFFEMGQQYGFLQAQAIRDLLVLLDSVADTESSGWMPRETQQTLRRMLGALFQKHFPASANEMLAGVRAGASKAGITLHPGDLAFLNSLIDIAGIGSTNLSFSADGWNAVASLLGALRNELGTGWIEQNCNSFAAWGSRSQDGKTFQTRNTDIKVGMGLERFPLVYVAFPKDAQGNKLIPYASAGFAGQIGVSTGMNAHGIGLGQIWAFSNAKAIGRPWSLAMMDVMTQSTSATQAGERLRAIEPARHTYGNNFIFADATGDGVVVELNAKHSDSFRSADPREVSEGQMPDGRIWAIPLQDALVRADFSMSRIIRADQTSARGPFGYPPEAGSYQKRYAGQIQRLLGFQQQGRAIGAREAAIISRATADRNAGNIQLAVYANTDRKFWVAYASEVGGHLRQAYQNPFIQIPFDTILSERGWHF